MLGIEPIAMLRLPLWFVAERKHESSPVHTTCDDPGAMLAFSTTQKLTAFLSERKAGEWKINLVGEREELILVIAIAHNQGLEAICLDPEEDGSGGERVSLNDLMFLANALR
jgi:hypothetical protein